MLKQVIDIAGQHLGIDKTKPQITAEREPLSDITTTDNEVKVVLEMPGIKKEDIKINAYDEKVEIKTAENAQRKYHKILDLPKQADLKQQGLLTIMEYWK